jgi:uncharacterized membrane protein
LAENEEDLMDPKEIVKELSRWIHVVAGIAWIGHLYFFNWVNANFVTTMDADTKKKVIPELMPRALFFFRMGAALTWLTGIILLGMQFYMVPGVMLGQVELGAIQWACFALIFVAPFIYDVLANTVLKDPTKGFWGGWILTSVLYLIFHHVAQFNWRGAAIHVGAIFGTIMAFNVWFRIWPNQKVIINGVKNGEAVDAAIPALAGLRSKHNTYMSVPLVFTMLNMHNTFAGPAEVGKFGASDLYFPIIVLVGFLATYQTYEIGKKVKGF